MVTLMKGGNTPVSAYIEATGAGAQAGCRAMVVDINSAEQARLVLREREAQLKLAQVASDLGVWEWECGTGDMCWSSQCSDILGVERGVPTLDALARLLHPEDSPRVRSIVSQALAAGTEHTVECRIIRPNGEVIWILVRGHVHLNKNGEPLRLIGIMQDITKCKQAEQNACDEAANKARCGANFIVPSATNLRS